jgi:hypothetical protein
MACKITSEEKVDDRPAMGEIIKKYLSMDVSVRHYLISLSIGKNLPLEDVLASEIPRLMEQKEVKCR